MDESPRERFRNTGRWWRYAVMRGDDIPTRLNGLWLDLDQYAASSGFIDPGPDATLEATSQWEMRDDGEVAVVYRWRRRP